MPASSTSFHMMGYIVFYYKIYFQIHILQEINIVINDIIFMHTDFREYGM
jgi:hypothetical protein